MENNRVILITGGGRGIGRAIAIRFAQKGFDVVAVARTHTELAETAALVEKHKVRCLGISTDVRDPAQVGDAVAETYKTFERIDVLVNSAGIAPMTSVDEMDVGKFRETMETNCSAVFYTCRAVLPIMRQQLDGVIVNISSIAALDPFPGFAVYGACKAWVDLFTKALAVEVKPHGIRVLGVGPGAVETQMLRGPFPTFPAERTLSPEQVADVVEWAADPRCEWISGQTIYPRKS